MAKLLCLDHARALTEPHHDAWSKAHKWAEDEWRRMEKATPEFAIAQTPSARRHNIHNLIARYLEQNPVDGATSTWRLGFFAQVVHHDEAVALVRFKFLGQEQTPRNHDSRQQKQLAFQQYTPEMMEQLKMDGVAEPPTFLTCGWLPAPDGSVEHVRVVCRHADRELYSYDIENGGEAAEIVPIRGLDGEPPRPRVTSRRKDQTGTDDEEGD